MARLIRGEDQPARRGQVVKNIHQLTAEGIRQIVEQAGAIDQVVLLDWRAFCPDRVLEHLEHRFLLRSNQGLTVEPSGDVGQG